MYYLHKNGEKIIGSFVDIAIIFSSHRLYTKLSNNSITATIRDNKLQNSTIKMLKEFQLPLKCHKYI